MTCRTLAMPLPKRYWKIGMTRADERFSSAAIASASASELVSGFSQTTCLPAAQRRHHHVVVEPWRRRDHHHVDIRPRQQVGEVSRACSRSRSAARRRCSLVASVSQHAVSANSSRNVRQAVAGVPIRNPSAADDRDVQALHRGRTSVAGKFRRPLFQKRRQAFGPIGRGVIAQDRYALERQSVFQRCAGRDRDAGLGRAYREGRAAGDDFGDLDARGRPYPSSRRPRPRSRHGTPFRRRSDFPS